MSKAEFTRMALKLTYEYLLQEANRAERADRRKRKSN